LSKLVSKVWLGWTRADRSVDNAVRYANCFGGTRGLFFYFLSRIFRAYRGRLIETRVAGTDIRLLVRLGTSDVSVFNGIYCWREYDWEFQKPPRVIVDAGAYTGLSSVFFAMRYPESQIIAIEPSDSNFEVLVRNSERFKNIKPVHAALWVQPGWLTVADPGRGAWGLQVKENRDMTDHCSERLSDNSGQLVRAITLSDILRDYGINRIDLLKLDIEGSERELFSDYEHWIGQVDSIIMELHDRFRAGCSRSFFKAIDEFPIESWRGENVLVMRNSPA